MVLSLAAYKVTSLSEELSCNTRDVSMLKPKWGRHHDTGARVSAMLAIFVVSLFAVSLPSLSRRKPSLRIPHIVFFIGKHFGTGVILSTAFSHLLQDAFKALHHPIVKARWDIEKSTGLIILCALLSIFLIEYISVSYVERLHSRSSAPPSPAPSFAPTRSPSPQPSTRDTRISVSSHSLDFPPNLPKDSANLRDQHDKANVADANEHTPLLPYLASRCPSHSRIRSKSFSYGSPSGRETGCDELFFHGHHRHEVRGTHSLHHARNPRTRPYLSPDVEQEPINVHGSEHAPTLFHSHSHWHSPEAGDEHVREAGVRIGGRRQIVGILVLQLGIMIHSFVIGLTLSILSSEFTSLVTAIMFHQLFEGLSLGVRISSLPSSRDGGSKRFPLLELTLSILFAITTPFGIGIGLLSFTKGTDSARILLMQGVTSAISAGMLIYAACVEMLAGDFMGPQLWQSEVWKQALGLVSLFAGVGVMTWIG